MRVLLATVLACALCGAIASAAGASSGVRYGIQDDAWLVHGPGTLDDRLDRLDRLGVDLVRFSLHWDQIEAVRGQPAWEDSDAVLKGLQAHGIPAVVGLVGSPRWANGGRTPNFAPGAASFAGFARAAATRYRWVSQWLVWNLGPARILHQLEHPARPGEPGFGHDGKEVVDRLGEARVMGRNPG